MRLSLLALALTTAAHPQWQIQTSNTTASLRGIHAISDQIAWASGTDGTVLHTTDGGATWLPCATPPQAEHLDFRGIQAFDATTAIVMSSGKGDLSRLYKTTDSCRSWRLVFTNPDNEGFWDALAALDKDQFEVIGDSVDHILVSEKTGHIVPVWQLSEGSDITENYTEHFFELRAETNEGGFAASNSTLAIGMQPHRDPLWRYQWLATKTPDHSFVHREGGRRNSNLRTLSP